MECYSKNPNKAIFESLIGKTVNKVEYSDLEYGDDYVALILSDGEKVTFHAEAPNKNDITWIKAEIK